METKETKEKNVKKKATTTKKTVTKAISKKNAVKSVQKEEVVAENVVDKELTSEKKKKSLGEIVFGIVLLIVILAVFIISKLGTPAYFAEVNFSKYESIIKESDSIVYVGNNEEEIDALTSLANNYKLRIYYLNFSKLTDEEKEATYSDGNSKLILTVSGESSLYDGAYTTASLSAAFADKGIINKGIQNITVAEYLNVIKEPGYHFMFVGSETCSWCNKFKPELESVIEAYNVNIYYVDLSSVSEDDYYSLIASNDYFSNNNWGTPTSFIYKDGVSLTTISGYKDAASIISILKEYKVVD